MSQPSSEPKTVPPIWHHALALPVRAILWTFRVLPAPIAYGIADIAAFGLLAWTATFERPRKGKPRSRGFYRNYEIVYREKANPRHRRRIMIGWARHLCHLSVDFCRLPKINANTIDKYLDTSDYSILRDIIKGGKGLIGTTGHIGCFEMGGYAAPLAGVPTAAIYSDSPIRPITELVTRIRAARGMKVISKEGATRGMYQCLRECMNVGFAVDVMTKNHPVYAPFLGILAATNRTAALLHLKTGAPIVVHTTTRLANFRFKFRVWAVIEHEKTGNKNADVLTIMTRINNELSRAILECPKQWFWHSRRFRYRPPGETLMADNLPPLVEESVHA